MLKVATDEQLGRAIRLRTHVTRREAWYLNKVIHSNDQFFRRKPGPFDSNLDQKMNSAEAAVIHRLEMARIERERKNAERRQRQMEEQQKEKDQEEEKEEA